MSCFLNCRLHYIKVSWIPNDINEFMSIELLALLAPSLLICCVLCYHDWILAKLKIDEPHGLKISSNLHRQRFLLSPSFLAIEIPPRQKRVTIGSRAGQLKSQLTRGQTCTHLLWYHVVVCHMDRWKRAGWKDEIEHSFTAQGLGNGHLRAFMPESFFCDTLC